jgi:glycosyltransferase involved in cell wall biosynthesis
MQISVIIPSYNRLQTLLPTIESVLYQTSAVDEIIVVDDGSTDATSDEVSRRYPEIKLIRQPNRGVSAARNAGIRSASFDWIALLDSDDRWLPEKIASIRAANYQQPEYLLFHSDEIWIRRGVRVNAMKKHFKSGGWIFENCLPLCVISPSAVVLRRSLLESCGYFDEDLPVCEDYDLWLKICHKHPVCYVDKPLISKYGGHEDQLSSRYWGMDRFRIRSLHRLLQQDVLSEQNHRSAVSTLNRKLEILLKGAYKHGNQKVIDEFAPILSEIRSLSGLKETIAC